MWAFGVVLYEMLTGTRPFVGDDVSKTLAHVIAIDPDWTALPDNVPPVLGYFVRGCLQKSPRQRIRDIGDVRQAMEGAFDTLRPAAVETSLAPPLPIWQRPIPLAFVAAVLVVASFFAGGIRTSYSVIGAAEVVRLSMVLPEGTEYLDGGSPRHGLAISPDGAQVVVRVVSDGQSHLFRRALGDLLGEPIPGTGQSLPV